MVRRADGSVLRRKFAEGAIHRSDGDCHGSRGLVDAAIAAVFSDNPSEYEQRLENSSEDLVSGVGPWLSRFCSAAGSDGRDEAPEES
jgi:hypothetical protein